MLTVLFVLHSLLQVLSAVLSACCSLITARQDKPWGLAIYAAIATASFLLKRAVDDLPTWSESNPKGSKLSVMLGGQLQQSRFLQLLPGLLSTFTQALQSLTTRDSRSAKQVASSTVAQSAKALLQIL